MSNALSPDHMTTAEWMDELASILATGVVRLRARKSSRLSANRGESCLDLTAHQSGYESVETKTEKPS